METFMSENYEVFGEFCGVLMDKNFTKYWEDVETFVARPDDILIATYPRSGIVGDWKNHFPEALSKRFDEHYKQQMKDCPVKFRTEL